jgi:hypothetical protein
MPSPALEREAERLKVGAPITLPAYWDELKAHDWGFEDYDDPEMYRNGRARHERIRKMADQSPEHMALYRAFEKLWPAWGEWPSEDQFPQRPLEKAA